MALHHRSADAEAPGLSYVRARWFASRQTSEPYFRQVTPLKFANGCSDGLWLGPAIGWCVHFRSSRPTSPPGPLFCPSNRFSHWLMAGLPTGQNAPLSQILTLVALS